MIKKHWTDNNTPSDIEAIKKSLSGPKAIPEPAKPIDTLDQLRMRTKALRERLHNVIRNRHQT